MTDEQRLAEYQRLCERAYIEISENWDKLVDPAGFGHRSLLTHLEKAKDGKEFRYITLAITSLAKALNKELEKNRVLERRLVELARNLESNTQIIDSYGEPNSNFRICAFCESESGAGLLDKGILHNKDCILSILNGAAIAKSGMEKN